MTTTLERIPEHEILPEQTDAAPELSARKATGAREADRLERMPLGLIHPSPLNPRDLFDQDKLDELAASIAEHGVLEPLVVRLKVAAEAEGGSGYEIIAGERRFRAARAAGLAEVPVIVRDVKSDRDALVLALVENLHRQDLNAMEAAQGYKKLTGLGYDQARIAHLVGGSVPLVSNTLRLLKLPAEVQALIGAGKLTRSHGLLILPLVGFENGSTKAEQEKQAVETARQAAEGGWSVKALEKHIQNWFPRAVKVEDVKADEAALPLDVPEAAPGGANFAAPHPEPLSALGDSPAAQQGDNAPALVNVPAADSDEEWEKGYGETASVGDADVPAGDDDAPQGAEADAGGEALPQQDVARADAGGDGGADDAPDAAPGVAADADAAQVLPPTPAVAPAAKTGAATSTPADSPTADEIGARARTRTAGRQALRDARQPDIAAALRSLDGLETVTALSVGTPAWRILTVIVDAALRECDGDALASAIEALGLPLDYDMIDDSWETAADRLDEYAKASGADLLRLALLTLFGGEILMIDQDYVDAPALDWFTATASTAKTEAEQPPLMTPASVGAGDRVQVLLGDSAGLTGIVDAVNPTFWGGKPAVKVTFNNGRSCLLRPDQLRPLPDDSAALPGGAEPSPSAEDAWEYQEPDPRLDLCRSCGVEKARAGGVYCGTCDPAEGRA